jgi:hypothetical protein
LGAIRRLAVERGQIYLAVKDEVDQDPSIVAAGINCLNDLVSRYNPCLAWNMLFEDRRLAWGCGQTSWRCDRGAGTEIAGRRS